MAKEFFLEIGSEEIPARSMEPVLGELRTRFESLLADARLDFSSVETLGSARRLVVHVSDLADEQASETVTKLGPPENIAFKDGEPTKALEGFAKKSGVAVERLRIFETERGRYAGFESRLEGRPAAEVLAEEIPALVRSLGFHKTMYWAEAGQRFARPIRWVVALHGSEVVPLELFGIRAGAESAGHRIIGSQSVTVSSFSDYLKKLEDHGVMVSQAARQSKIESELEEMARGLGGKILRDDDLLNEVTYINEYPTVIAGSFEKRFLVLPPEILVTVMKAHQKYFAVETADGKLLPNFLAVINTRGDQKGLIRKGHERVLKARLSDALFFWEVDGRQTLEERVASLDRIVFHNALGTYLDKVGRMARLAEAVNRLTGAGVASDVLDSVVRWAKADLNTGLVGEFPDLQGVIGGLYARREGASEEIAAAIYDQYRPAGLDDRSPNSLAGVVLSLTDRLDTVFGCFSVGLLPTGSEDPLGLRRHTQGVIKTLLDRRLKFSVQAAIEADGRMSAEATEQFRGFYEDRIRYILSRKQYAYDEINAALATSSDNPANVLDRVEALHAVRERPDFLALATAFKRIKNILKQSEAAPASPVDDPVEGELEPAEAALALAVDRIAPQVKAWSASRDYARTLEAMASLRPVVDEFFDKILVMHEDAEVRRRRVGLLRQLFNTFLEVADISEVVVSG